MTDTSDAGHLADDLSAEVVDPWACLLYTSDAADE